MAVINLNGKLPHTELNSEELLSKASSDSPDVALVPVLSNQFLI